MDLAAEEKEMLDAYHEGRLEPVVLDASQIEEYREAARAVTRKSERVNIRSPLRLSKV